MRRKGAESGDKIMRAKVASALRDEIVCKGLKDLGLVPK